MRYYKQVADGYITAIGTADGPGAGTITEAEYTQLAALIAERPFAPDGKTYRLTIALDWELYDLPMDSPPVAYTEAELAKLSNSELEKILSSYGIPIIFNKENMISLILEIQKIQF